MKAKYFKALAAGLLLLGGTAQAQTARVQVIHNSADALAETVDIYLNGDLAIDDFGFREATAFLDLPAEVEVGIGVAPGNSMDASDVIATFPVTLADGGTYVVMATGLLDAGSYTPFEAFTLNIFDMGQESAMMAGNTDLLVYHGATDVPSVDVTEVGVGAGQIIDGMAYGDFAGGAYLQLPTLDFVLDITLDDGTPTGIQYEAPLATLGTEGAAAVVFASGFLNPAANNNGPEFGLWVALPDGTTLPLPAWEPSARVQIIHNCADALADPVDIYINGDLAIDDLAFRAATPFLDIPAYNEIEVAIAPGNSMDVSDAIAVYPVALEDGATYVVSASGLLDNLNYNPFQPFDLRGYDFGQEAAMTAGNTDVLVFHGGTDAPAVDVVEIGAGAGLIIDGLAFGEYTDYLELPTADYALEITLDDGTPTGLRYAAPLASLGLDGAALVVFASGFLDPSQNNDGAAFGLWVALPDGTTLPLPVWEPTARVQVIHNSGDALAAEVDIYLNGDLAIDDFAYRTASPFLDLPAYDEIVIGVAPGNSMGSEDIIAEFPVTLAPDGSYIVMATGLLDAGNYNPFEAFTLNVFDMAQESAMMAGNTDVLVYHGSTDAPAVDVFEIGVGAGQIIDGMSYGDFAGGAYLELPTLDFILDITLDDETPTGLRYEAPLATLGLEDAALVVFASGFLDPSQNNDGAAFGLWVALPDGTTLPLPVWEPTARVQVIHNSGDALAAEVDVYINGALAIDDFAYRSATPYLDLPAYDEIVVGIAPGNSMDADDVIANFPFTLEEGGTYVVMATGLLDDQNYDPFQAFTLAATAGQEAAMMGTNTDLLVYHGATDAPTVDVYEVGLAAGELINDLSYGAFSNGYLGLANDNYYVQIRLEDGVTDVATYSAPLESLGLAGGAGVVFASGFLDPANNNNGEAFGLWVALPDGTTLPLPVLGTAPENNVCSAAAPVTVGTVADCANNTVSGDLEDAWNDYGTPACELAGVLPGVYYSFNTGEFTQVTVDIEAVGGAGPEIGYEVLSACGTPAEGLTNGCAYNASVTGPVTIGGLELNTEYILLVYSNLDFGNSTGAFNLCLSGSGPDNVTDLSAEASLFSVYPNPNNGVFSIEFNTDAGFTSVDVLDLSGKLVASEQFAANNGTRMDMNLDLAPGMYMLRLTPENGVAETQRFIVE